MTPNHSRSRDFRFTQSRDGLFVPNIEVGLLLFSDFFYWGTWERCWILKILLLAFPDFLKDWKSSWPTSTQNESPLICTLGHLTHGTHWEWWRVDVACDSVSLYTFWMDTADGSMVLLSVVKDDVAIWCWFYGGHHKKGIYRWSIIYIRWNVNKLEIVVDIKKTWWT